jgi:hypothetical protein
LLGKLFGGFWHQLLIVRRWMLGRSLPLSSRAERGTSHKLFSLRFVRVSADSNSEVPHPPHADSG